MRVTQTWSGYNPRRYSRPWISKVTAWPIGGKPEVAWGTYNGTDAGGEVEIEAEPGDIIRTGQKDGRGGNTVADWYVVQPDGTLTGVTAAEAKDAWLKRTAATPLPTPDLSTISDEVLLAEVRRRGL